MSYRSASQFKPEFEAQMTDNGQPPTLGPPFDRVNGQTSDLATGVPTLKPDTRTPNKLEPIQQFKCTYKDCLVSFSTEKAMRRHKKYSAEHDFCEKCDLDFDSYEDLAHHKIVRPDKHGKACRVCGDEFKSDSGLKRHIELNHKMNQKLHCIGCGEEFYKASLMIEHLEYGHCKEISALEYQAHIIHKHLITELLKGGSAYDRFMQKISKFDAAQDHEEEGGVGLDQDDFFSQANTQDLDYKALQPENSLENEPTHPGPYPVLPSQAASDVVSSLEKMSVSGDSDAGTVLGGHPTSSDFEGSQTHKPKPWMAKNGKSASQFLFKNAKPTPPPSDFSISHHDDRMEQEYGINIMKKRFWDPMSNDWNPERFYDSVINKYYCPFICEQTFPIPGDLNSHILHDHRITRMKCPSCLKYFNSSTALVGHCESLGTKCTINKADDFNIFLDKLTGGFLAVEERIRPDHLHNPAVMIQNPDSGRMERYVPPVASYLQYSATKPLDWKEADKTAWTNRRW